jgi:hypothetical protein
MPTLVQPFPMRSTVSDYEGRLQITVPLRQFGAGLFIAFWLAGWTYGGVAILRKLIEKPSLFEAVWICFWAVSLPFAVYTLLRMLAGTDVVLVDQHRFVIRREIFGVGLGKQYLASEMRDLRFQPEVGSGRSHRYSRVAFDYGAKTVTFGERLEEAEATQLISLINQRCNISQTPPPDGSTPHFWQGR